MSDTVPLERFPYEEYPRFRCDEEIPQNPAINSKIYSSVVIVFFLKVAYNFIRQTKNK